MMVSDSNPPSVYTFAEGAFLFETGRFISTRIIDGSQLCKGYVCGWSCRSCRIRCYARRLTGSCEEKTETDGDWAISTLAGEFAVTSGE